MTTPEDKVELLDEQTGEASEEGVKSAKALVQTFLQTVKGYRLYESNHPILLKFLERLKKDFDNYFEEFPSFSLQIGEHRLFYHGNVVYESQDIKESLAFAFFKDGVREIRFHKGLDLKEILDFLNVVRKSDLVNRMEDDLVTLLWEKDFSHISFTTIDEFLEKSGTFVPATEEDLMNGMELKGTEADGYQESTDPAQAEGFNILTDDNLKKAINPSPGQSLVDACQLAAEEVEKINREVSQEHQPEHLYVLVDSLIEILLHLGEDMDAYENMISFFERINQNLLDQGEVGKAVEILKKFKGTMEDMVLKDKQIFAIRRILEGATSQPSVKLLGKAMLGDGETNSESILQYLPFLTDKAILPLCLLLGELESPKRKKVVSDLLVILAREDITPLLKFLSDRNSLLVCHILYILGKIGNPSALKHLGNLTGHSDLKVREETLQMLVKFGEKGKDLIQRFLKDPAPEVRGKASIALARAVRVHAVKPLTEIILSEDFHKRDYEEKVYFFKALGETGSEEAIPVLEQIAKKKNWFKKAKWEEMRICATNTLRMMETEKRAVR
ncbi:MAG: HEAT repeat domain-containing protein [Desulfobacterales bacterium]|nr:HEAT repeat domain-containing protein [Desulfobacterales bacterium]